MTADFQPSRGTPCTYNTACIRDLITSSSGEFRRYEPVHSYREQKYSYQLAERFLTITNTCISRDRLYSLEAACPIVFSISELISEVNTFKYIRCLFLFRDLRGSSWSTRPYDPRYKLVKFAASFSRFSPFNFQIKCDLNRNTKVQIILREWREASPCNSFDSHIHLKYLFIIESLSCIYMYVTLN